MSPVQKQHVCGQYHTNTNAPRRLQSRGCKMLGEPLSGRNKGLRIVRHGVVKRCYDAARELEGPASATHTLMSQSCVLSPRASNPPKLRASKTHRLETPTPLKYWEGLAVRDGPPRGHFKQGTNKPEHGLCHHVPYRGQVTTCLAQLDQI